ncbi:MAG: tRNA epoxyqueuosine(34) reductase QueG [Gemmatimonadetes bacterium]|nr:tRNA epoxyqueuosine(34) reductase QueG [Gemmatimonadota bacterium]
MATQGHAPLSPGARAQLVKHRALALGFARAGIADLAPVPHQPALLRWLEQGMAGTMRYMHRQAGRRIEPATILPGATRAVVVTRNYYSEDSPPTPGTGRVARYARGRDYHVALEPSLAELARYITSLGPKGTLAKPYCDAGPVPERELAQRAGLGWIGKNTMLIDPERGSYCFLAVILTDLDLAVDLPFEADRCGTCRLCLDACPTHAFPDARVLDSRSCISYLTIEHRGEVDPALATGFGDWIFGCDICQEVCPWNVKFAEVADDPVLKPDPGLARLDLVELSRISDAEFRAKYGKTALSRPGASGMRRNARLALRFTAETAQIAEQDSRPE